MSGSCLSFRSKHQLRYFLLILLLSWCGINLYPAQATPDNDSFTPDYTYTDQTEPTVVISSDESSPTSSSSFEVTATFSEAVTGFESGDITITGGTISDFTTSDNTIFTFVVTPTGDGTIKVDISASVATNATGDDNTAAQQFSIESDQTAPTVTFSTTETSPSNSQYIAVTATFSEEVSGFTSGDLLVSGAEVTDFTTTDNTTFIFELNPDADGTIQADIDAGVTTDAAGNDNTAATQFTIVSDRTAPTVTITTEESEPISSISFEIIITLSEKVHAFEDAYIHVEDGVFVDLEAVDDTIYKATIEPLGSGPLVISLGTVTNDFAGNRNEPATITLEIDLTAPWGDIRGVPASTINPFDISILFGETVFGFTEEDITLENASMSNFTKVSSTRYSATITPTDDYRITTIQGSYMDAAGNLGGSDFASGFYRLDGLAGDVNGDGQIGAGELAGDVNNDGIIGDGEIAGDLDGEGTIGHQEVAGDIDGDREIGADEIAGDIDGSGTINNSEIAGDINADGSIAEDEIAGDINGDGTLGYQEIAGNTDGNDVIDGSEIAGDTNGNNAIDPNEKAGDINGNGSIGHEEIAGDINGNEAIENDEIAGDFNGDKSISVGEITGDVNGTGMIESGEIAGDGNGNGVIDNHEIAGDISGEGVIGTDEVVGDASGNGIIDNGEIAGDLDGTGSIENNEIAGDLNGNEIIDANEIAGDIDGNGTIENDEIAGDITGDGSIGLDELAGDVNGNGAIGIGETAGDVDGSGSIDESEIQGDTNGDGRLTGEDTTILHAGSQSEIVIYPNPSSDLIHVKIKDHASEFVVIDVSGMKHNVPVIRTPEGLKLDIQALKKGVYFLVLQQKQVHAMPFTKK